MRREAFAEAHASLRRDTLLALGDVLYSRGRFAEAEEVFAEAEAVTVEAEDRFGEAAARLNRAAPELLAGALAASAMGLVGDDPAEAKRRVDEASGLLATASDPWAQVYDWADRLRVLWATAPREELRSSSGARFGIVLANCLRTV